MEENQNKDFLLRCHIFQILYVSLWSPAERPQLLTALLISGLQPPAKTLSYLLQLEGVKKKAVSGGVLSLTREKDQ